jgi:predicted nucleic acid-binding protein
VDAAILVSALIGKGFGALVTAGRSLILVTTDRAVEETRRRVMLGLRRPDLIEILDDLVLTLEVVKVANMSSLIKPAERYLKDAAPSRNGTVTDAHILALAWELDADIWSHDRDFTGTGVATWSTANLMWALAEADA